MNILICGGAGNGKTALAETLAVRLSATPLPSSEEIRQSITCEINSYAEWISALSISNQYKEYLGDALYHIVFDLLLDKIGLKAVFVENRFKEKGWN